MSRSPRMPRSMWLRTAATTGSINCFSSAANWICIGLPTGGPRSASRTSTVHAGEIGRGLAGAFQDFPAGQRAFPLFVHLHVHPADGVVGIREPRAAGAAVADLGLQHHALDARDVDDARLGFPNQGVGFGRGEIAAGAHRHAGANRIAV